MSVALSDEDKTYKCELVRGPDDGKVETHQGLRPPLHIETDSQLYQLSSYTDHRRVNSAKYRHIGELR